MKFNHSPGDKFTNGIVTIYQAELPQGMIEGQLKMGCCLGVKLVFAIRRKIGITVLHWLSEVRLAVVQLVHLGSSSCSRASASLVQSSARSSHAASSKSHRAYLAFERRSFALLRHLSISSFRTTAALKSAA